MHYQLENGKRKRGGNEFGSWIEVTLEIIIPL